MLFVELAYSQQIPKGYQLYASIKKPKDLSFAHEMMIDSMNNHLLMLYGASPSYVEFYEIGSWQFIKRVEIPKEVNLKASFVRNDNVYFFTSKCYFEYNKNNNKVKRIGTNKVPGGIRPTSSPVEVKYNVEPKNLITFFSKYILYTDDYVSNIYIPISQSGIVIPIK